LGSSFWAFVLGTPDPRSSGLVFGRLVLGARSWALLILVPPGLVPGVLVPGISRSWRFILVPGVVGRYAADSGLLVVVADWVF
jgi:hypothetical protein